MKAFYGVHLRKKNAYQRGSAHVGLMLFIALIVGLTVGGGVYWWQQTVLEQRTVEAEDQISSLAFKVKQSNSEKETLSTTVARLEESLRKVEAEKQTLKMQYDQEVSSRAQDKKSVADLAQEKGKLAEKITLLEQKLTEKEALLAEAVKEKDAALEDLKKASIAAQEAIAQAAHAAPKEESSEGPSKELTETSLVVPVPNAPGTQVQ